MSQVWLVTGSSRGLGRHVVEAALERGDRVLATARRPEVLDDLVAAYGDRVRTVAHDVAVPAQATAAVQAALERVRPARRRRQQRRLRRSGLGGGHERRGVPRPGRDRLLRHRAHHQGRAPDRCASRAAGTSSTSRPSAAGWRPRACPPTRARSGPTAGFSAVLAAEVAPLGIRVTSLEPGGMDTDWAGSSMDVPRSARPTSRPSARPPAMHTRPGVRSATRRRSRR